MEMKYRMAVLEDAELLATFNQQLIRDEGHRNPMPHSQLAERMSGWLEGDYRAMVIEIDQMAVGYVLYKREAEFTYVRQLFVVPNARRQGIARRAIEWLRQHAWSDAPRLRIDVLVGNAVAIAFWRSVGFHEYCITMESG